MADIAVRCRKCRKVTHWLTNFKKVWQCPLCNHPASTPVVDGREVAYDDDAYTRWVSSCYHGNQTSPWEPAQDICSQCGMKNDWYKDRDLDAIVPPKLSSRDEEDTIAMKVINVLLDRLTEKTPPD